LETSVATAQAIERISSAGDFEILALQVLKMLHEECRLLIHMGMNAEGKTTRGPLDAFCKVPGSEPPRFVMAAFTTHKPDSLKRKWLSGYATAKGQKKGGPAKDGDLMKAAHKAGELRETYPDATFALYLCSNRPLNLKESLVDEVYAIAEAKGIQVVILEQSLIRDCLMTPEGQWLRQQYLGIEAQLVSIQLLKTLSEKSVQQHRQTFFHFSSADFVETENQRSFMEVTRRSNATLHLVTGPSGAGKSVVSYQILRDHVRQGGIGFYIPGDVIVNAQSIEMAFDHVLRYLHPPIVKNAVEVTKGLACGNFKILFVIDNLTDSGKQPEVINRILRWTNPLPRGDDDSIQDNSWLIIVPSADAFSVQFDDIDKCCNWVRRTAINRMSVDDASLCLSEALGNMASSFSNPELEHLAKQLDYLPILIQMCARSLRLSPDADVQILANEALTKFISSCTLEVASQGEFLQADCDQALLELARNMVCMRELAPYWKQVTLWLTGRQVSAISRLVSVERICRVVKQEESRFKFTHDCILEYFLTNALGPMLREPEKNDEVLSDPFYSLFLGPSVAKRSPEENVVIWIREHNPLALIAAVKFLKPGNNNAASILLGHAKRILAEFLSTQNAPSPLAHEACRILSESDSNFVLEVTEPVRTHPLIWPARLAQGDALAGAYELSEQELFWPSVRSDSLANILKRVTTYHYRRLVSGCEEMLRKPDLPGAIQWGALCLTGFIGTDELSTSIKIAWDSDQDKTSILVPALWAAMRCGSLDPPGLLEPMIELWSSLSDEKANGNLSQRRAITDKLKFAMRHINSGKVLEYLVKIAETDERLSEDILWLLEEVDHPVSVRFLVKVWSEREHIAEHQSGISPWAGSLRSRRDPTTGFGNRLSPDSRDAIRGLWADDENEEWLKKGAFKFWVQATDDLADLQGIAPEHPYFLASLWRRALLGDQTATPYIEPLLVTDSKWFAVIARIWHNDFVQATNVALSNLRTKAGSDLEEGETNEHYMFANLIRDIPREDAEKLLLSNWEHLRFSKLFVQLALYLGTEQCIELAKSAVERSSLQHNILENVGLFFGFYTQGLSDKLCKFHLENLQPFLQKLDDHTVASMIDFCHRHGHRSWSQSYLLPEVNRRNLQIERDENEKSTYLQNVKRFYFPSDDELIAGLNDLDQRQGWISVIPWCEGFTLPQDDANRWRKILELWLGQSPSINQLQIAGLIVCELGRRKDLELITRYDIEGPPGALEQIISNVTYIVKRRSLN
jgi:hypothetical protein